MYKVAKQSIPLLEAFIGGLFLFILMQVRVAEHLVQQQQRVPLATSHRQENKTDTLGMTNTGFLLLHKEGLASTVEWCRAQILASYTGVNH